MIDDVSGVLTDVAQQMMKGNQVRSWGKAGSDPYQQFTSEGDLKTPDASRLHIIHSRRTMIARHWRGWTRNEDADAYEKMLQQKVIPSLREIEGYQGGYILRSDGPSEVEFVVLNFFAAGGEAVRRRRLRDAGLRA